MKETLDKKYIDPYNSFKRIFLLQKGLFLIKDFKWKFSNFNFQDFSVGSANIRITYNASILNLSGDSNKLFPKYDSIRNDIRTEYGNELSNMSIIPNNIDMNIKYFTYPLRIDINERR